MPKQFSLGTLLLTFLLGSACFYGGWLSHARVHPRVQVNAERQAPHQRGGGPGHVVVSIDVGSDTHRFRPGDKVAIACESQGADGVRGETVGGSHTVFEVGGGSISLLVHSDLREQIVADLQRGNCQLIRASP